MMDDATNNVLEKNNEHLFHCSRTEIKTNETGKYIHLEGFYASKLAGQKNDQVQEHEKKEGKNYSENVLQEFYGIWFPLLDIYISNTKLWIFSFFLFYFHDIVNQEIGPTKLRLVLPRALHSAVFAAVAKMSTT